MLVKGKVIDNRDSEGMGRLRVQINGSGTPDENVSDWYHGCLPSRSFILPSIGEYVWLMPTNQAKTEYVWMGWATGHYANVNTEQISEANGKGATFKAETQSFGRGRKVLLIDREPEDFSVPTRHTIAKTHAGITFFADDDRFDLRKALIKETDSADAKGIEQRKLLTTEDNFQWGMEDPLGNRIVCIHEKSRGSSIYITTADKNSVTLVKGKVILDAGEGTGEIIVRSTNSDAEGEALVLGDQLKILLDALYKALNEWIPMPQDGGSALKTKLASFLASYSEYEGSKSYLTRKKE